MAFPMASGGESAQKQAVETPRHRKLTDEEVEQVASFCHSANRLYQAMNGEEPSPPWPEAPEWQKESARKGVRHVLEGGLAAKYPGLGGPTREEDQHNAWMEEKLRAGWTYGAVKNPVAKTHPCLLPYRSLPAWQRRKDRLFGALCRALDPREEA